MLGVLYFKQMADLKFPEGFLWGAATSAYQVEGGIHNDWSAWEAAGKATERSGNAADHWNRYEADFDLLKDMNLGVYRMSVEWARIEPLPGQFDQAAIQQYREMLQALRKRGVEPLVTLHHFTNPIWVGEQGGWSNGKTVKSYLRFVDYVVQELGAEVGMWCTVNEPSLATSMAYLNINFPPGKRSWWKYLKARRNFVRAHNLAYGRIHGYYQKQQLPRPMVGLAHNMTYVGAEHNGLDRLAAAIFRYLVNGYFLERTRRHCDYIGLNYYFYRRVFVHPGAPKWLGESPDPGLPVSDLGWRVYPRGLRRLCTALARYKKPIIITENGVADANDHLRPRFIVEHLIELHRAISEGADVRGYIHWALIDNFEWEHGYRGRFGLVAVDFTTQARTPRASAKLYGQIAEHNTVTSEMVEKYQ
jgi:beta-glucosidase